jgi:hypothetical protein
LNNSWFYFASSLLRDQQLLKCKLQKQNWNLCQNEPPSLINLWVGFCS